ncbi:MAG TPA: hypothetical protein VLG50_07645 [Candidatus Saccharimonadales bacterium]|nr:hypothetical protein [Candidatus Saccharimonadales bacterium]
MTSDVIKTKMNELLKKREYDYNHQKPMTESDLEHYYTNNTVVLVNNHLPIQDKKKAIHVEIKKLSNIHKSKTIKITSPHYYHIDNDIVGCHYQIKYYEPMKAEIYQLLQKLTFKDVNMDQLIDDLYHHGYDVNDMLSVLYRYDKNELTNYFNQLDIANLLVIIHKHGITAQKLLQNAYVHDLIKQSGGSWFLSLQNMKPITITSSTTTKVSHTRLVSICIVYVIYKLKHNDLTILNINWS